MSTRQTLIDNLDKVQFKCLKSLQIWMLQVLLLRMPFDNSSTDFPFNEIPGYVDTSTLDILAFTLGLKYDGALVS